MGDIPTGHRAQWLANYKKQINEFRERLAGSSEELNWALKNLVTGKRTEEGLEAATQITDICLHTMLANLIQPGPPQLRFKNEPASVAVRQLNLSQGDAVRYVQLGLAAGFIDFTNKGFNQTDLRKFWDTEPFLHDDLIRYVFRPAVYLRPIEAWAEESKQVKPTSGLSILVNPLATFVQFAWGAAMDNFWALYNDDVRLIGLAFQATLPYNQLLRYCADQVTWREGQLWEETLRSIATNVANHETNAELVPFRWLNFAALGGNLMTYFHGALLRMHRLSGPEDGTDTWEKFFEEMKLGARMIIVGYISMTVKYVAEHPDEVRELIAADAAVRDQETGLLRDSPPPADPS